MTQISNYKPSDKAHTAFQLTKEKGLFVKTLDKSNISFFCNN